MSGLDIAVITIVLIAGLVAFSMGFVRVVLALSGWVGAAFATMYGFSYVKPFAREWISPGFLANAVAGLSIFIATLVVLTIISHAVGRQVRNSGLSALDRSLGLVFGLFLGAVIVSLGYISIGAMTDLSKDTAKQPEWIRNARSKPWLEWGAGQLQALAPPEFRGITDNAPSSREESLKRFNKLNEPGTRKAAGQNRQGYSNQERREMDRLIKGQRQ
jgi:membrane protein required for colicin V production